MQNRVFLFLFVRVGAVLLSLLLLSCAAPPVGREVILPQPRVSIPNLEKEIHQRVNGERRQQGLSPLAWDDRLARIAGKHSRDMAERNFFSHNSPEGHDFAHRYQEEGYRCAHQVGRAIYSGGENLLQTHLYDSVIIRNGQRFHHWLSEERIAGVAVEIWMKSPAHRKNILSPYYQREGLGIAIAADGQVYITQDFC